MRFSWRYDRMCEAHVQPLLRLPRVRHHRRGLALLPLLVGVAQVRPMVIMPRASIRTWPQWLFPAFVMEPRRRRLSLEVFPRHEPEVCRDLPGPLEAAPVADLGR